MNSLIALQGEGVREPYMKMRNDRRRVRVCVFVRVCLRGQLDVM